MGWKYFTDDGMKLAMAICDGFQGIVHSPNKGVRPVWRIAQANGLPDPVVMIAHLFRIRILDHAGGKPEIEDHTIDGRFGSLIGQFDQSRANLTRLEWTDHAHDDQRHRIQDADSSG
jgi:hypothetical protein